MNTRRKTRFNYCESSSDNSISTKHPPAEDMSTSRVITRKMANNCEPVMCSVDKSSNLFQISLKSQDSSIDLSKLEYSSLHTTSLKENNKRPMRKKKDKSSISMLQENIPDFSNFPSLNILTESSREEKSSEDNCSDAKKEKSIPLGQSNVIVSSDDFLSDLNEEKSSPSRQSSMTCIYSTPLNINTRKELQEDQLGSPILSPPEIISPVDPKLERIEKLVYSNNTNMSSDMFAYSTRASSKLQSKIESSSVNPESVIPTEPIVTFMSLPRSQLHQCQISSNPDSNPGVSTPDSNLGVSTPDSNGFILSPPHTDKRLTAGKKGKKSIARVTHRPFRGNTSLLNNSFITDSSFWNHIRGSSKETMLKLSRQKAPMPFSKVFPKSMCSSINKIGEGLFGEVFSATVADKTMVYKVFPIEGDLPVNGEPQKTFEEVLPEVVTSKELTHLGINSQNLTQNFIDLINVSVIKGRFPSYLNRAWNLYHETVTSENDNPNFLPSTQLWLVLHYGFGGMALEDFQFDNPEEALSLMRQVILTLAIAESALQFEHRDLHHGNILVRRLDNTEELNYVLTPDSNDAPSLRFTIPQCSIKILIIDFTLSRIAKDNYPLFFDLSTDEEMFMGENDYQFEIYRMMRQENNNDWSSFKPKTNIFWLHYLSLKILERFTTEDHVWDELQKLSDSILTYKSVTQIALEHFILDKCRH